MGKISFPLNNIRKDVVSQWHMKHFTDTELESITVPTTANEHGYYTAWLSEVPDSGSSASLSPPRISGLTEYRGEAVNSKTNRLNINATQFFVNY